MPHRIPVVADDRAPVVGPLTAALHERHALLFRCGVDDGLDRRLQPVDGLRGHGHGDVPDPADRDVRLAGDLVDDVLGAVRGTGDLPVFVGAVVVVVARDLPRELQPPRGLAALLTAADHAEVRGPLHPPPAVVVAAWAEGIEPREPRHDVVGVTPGLDVIYPQRGGVAGHFAAVADAAHGHVRPELRGGDARGIAESGSLGERVPPVQARRRSRETGGAGHPQRPRQPGLRHRPRAPPRAGDRRGDLPQLLPGRLDHPEPVRAPLRPEQQRQVLPRCLPRRDLHREDRNELPRPDQPGERGLAFLHLLELRRPPSVAAGVIGELRVHPLHERHVGERQRQPPQADPAPGQRRPTVRLRLNQRLKDVRGPVDGVDLTEDEHRPRALAVDVQVMVPVGDVTRVHGDGCGRRRR